MSGDARTLLAISDVTKSFPGVKALDRVNFDVRAGEVHGLVGENGAGKSTLMAIASGTRIADQGTVVLDGYRVSGEPEEAREKGLAIVRQEPLLMPDLTVVENIYLGVPEPLRPRIRDMKAFAEKALLQWSGDTNIDVQSRVDSLSPEKKFIIEIVKALACEVKVLILDEPTEHLGAADVQRLFERIRAIAKSGAAVVYISHRLKEVQEIADRLTVLRDGRSLGTYEAHGLSEDEIITLIVGTSPGAEFPSKSTTRTSKSEEVLSVRKLSGQGFRDVSLTMTRGEIVGLAGIEANGQREFIRSMAGLNRSEGSITLNGKAVTVHSAPAALSAGFSYLPGDRHREGIVASLSVRENFSIRSLAQDIRGLFINRTSEAERSLDAIRAFAIKTPTIETPIDSLSGGNQQKVVLASVLASRPKLLLADEPTQGVDVGARMEIYKILRETADSGVPIMIVSSDAAEIAGLCDQVMIFSRGTIVERLTGHEVTENNITAAVLKSTSIRDHSETMASGFWKWAAGDAAPIVMLAAVILAMGVVAAILNPTYLSPRSLTGMMTQVATLAVVAYGQQLLMLVGGIDLSVGPLMGLVQVLASFFLFKNAGLDTQLLGWVIMVVAMIAVGIVNFGLIELIRLHPLVATLATYMGIQAVSLMLRPLPKGMINLDILDDISIKVSFIPVAFVVVACAGVLLEFVLFKNKLGIFIRGHGSRPEAARIAGISPRRTRLIAYVGCSIFAGAAGILMMGQVGVGDPHAGVGYTLASIASIVIGGASLFGGRGSFVGALFGAVFIIQINQVTAFIRLNVAWSEFLLGAMILGAVALYSKSRMMVQAA